LKRHAGHLGGGVLDRLDDVLIAGAPAQVAGDAEADLLLARVRVLLQQAVRAHDHAGRAEAALKPVHLAKAFLQGGQRAVGSGHAFDRQDLGAIGLDGEHGAGLHRLAVEVHRAGAAMAGLAADMRAGQVELLAQEMDQQRARFDEGLDRLAVDLERDLRLRHDRLPQRARDLARASARATITPAILVRYSTGPRRSAAGDVIASAAATTRLTVSASSPVPATSRDASSAQSGVSPTLVSAMEQVAMRSPLSVRTTAAAAVA